MSDFPKYVDAVICATFRQFKESIQAGNSIAQAAIIGESELLYSRLPKLHPGDIDHACERLVDIGYLEIDIEGTITLEDEGITYMENRFKNGLKEVVEFLGNLIP